ncbi:hypothetical protein BD410DRAFT_781798 [Rickenella mellea]|uniref:Uncharacterized protein n=1 Tax=Rickenella mellea TaxID=50990 RepID=A0A4Y7QJQ3_9AGAM|nr:hypothetical protein BD410DRAFT_781798 [Rickenella mellea]
MRAFAGSKPFRSNILPKPPSSPVTITTATGGMAVIISDLRRSVGRRTSSISLTQHPHPT